jgi:ribonuclease HII
VERPFSAAKASAYPVAIGCDEVGRGALCGPVVVAAVWFDPRDFPRELLVQLDDSKKIRAPVREELAVRILAHSRTIMAASSASTIDRDGIRRATLDAMRRAISAMAARAPVYVDGRDVPPGLGVDCTALVRGESLIPQIAASSIVAKVCRDRIMRMLARRHQAYRWETNSGYGTADHLDALHRLGATRHHRRTFAPVTSLLERRPQIDVGELVSVAAA